MTRTLGAPTLGGEMAGLKKRVSDLERRLRELSGVTRKGARWEHLAVAGLVTRAGTDVTLDIDTIVDHQTHGVVPLIPNMGGEGIQVGEPGVYITTLTVALLDVTAEAGSTGVTVSAALTVAGTSGGQRPLDVSSGPVDGLDVAACCAGGLSATVPSTIMAFHEVTTSPGGATPDYTLQFLLSATWQCPTDMPPDLPG